jgi:hypothetical protein
MGKIRAKAVLALAVAVATGLATDATVFGQRLETPLPTANRVTYVAQPAPIPMPSEGRIPVSLRLSTSIEMKDGSHPPPARELRFAFDRHYRLALDDVPTCPPGIRSQGRTGESPCPEAEIASGRSKWDVAFPGQGPVQVEGRTVAYKIPRGKIAIHVFLPAPVTADVVATAALSRAPKKSRYGLVVTASLPKVAGGNGSLIYMRLRFHKGLFSVACPQRKLQSSLAARFIDATRASVTALTTC